MSHEPRLQQLSDDFESLGLRPFHTPLGVMLDEKNPHASKCIRCGTCDGFPCLIYGKSDAQSMRRRSGAAECQRRVDDGRLRREIHYDSSGGKVSKVIVRRNGNREDFSADIVVSSCGAINSAALLLRSRNDQHPHGLANSSDTVGRHYMGHVNSVLMALSKCPNPTVFQKSLSLNDFYFGAAGWNYPMGHISFVGKLDGETLKAARLRSRQAGRWI